METLAHPYPPCHLSHTLLLVCLQQVVGAWNASIVSEYVQFNNKTHSTFGLGASIAEFAAAGQSHFPKLLGRDVADGYLCCDHQSSTMEAFICARGTPLYVKLGVSLS